MTHETNAFSEERVAATVREICREIEERRPGEGPFSAETSLIDDVALDSAATMMLVFDLEEKFDVSIPLNDLSDVRTIGELGRLIASLREGGSD